MSKYLMFAFLMAGLVARASLWAVRSGAAAEGPRRWREWQPAW